MPGERASSAKAMTFVSNELEQALDSLLQR
jgi:hypothetical protein